MHPHQLNKFARRAASSLLFTALILTALSTSLTANADTMTSEASGKTMSMDHKDMDHHHMKMTGDQDYDFAMMMRMHHVKGVKMAEEQLEKGKDPDMRAAAKKIVEAQKKEIAEFDKWLAAHPPKSK
jgi:uncharacterized protein (DUF305 family)